MEWKDLGNSLLGLAPTLAHLTQTPAVARVVDVLADALGVSDPTPDKLQRAIEANPDVVKEAERDNKQEMLKLLLKFVGEQGNELPPWLNTLLIALITLAGIVYVLIDKFH